MESRLLELEAGLAGRVRGERRKEGEGKWVVSNVESFKATGGPRYSSSEIECGGAISMSISDRPGTLDTRPGHGFDAFAGLFRQLSKWTWGWSHCICAAIVTMKGIGRARC